MNLVDGSKIALFSDCHLGKYKDSSSFIEITTKFFENFLEQTKGKVDAAIFAGDFYDNRNAINIMTNCTGYDILKSLSMQFPIYLIVGNHDTHLKESLTINSLKTFSEMTNVYVIDHNTEIHFDTGKTAILCPWKSDPLDPTRKYDYAIGHFDVSDVISPWINTGGRYTIEELVKGNSSMIFSGHYHIRKEIQLSEGLFVSIGCPYELDWGDEGNEKGWYFLDTGSNKLEFIRNNDSPIHAKIYWSKILSKEQVITRDLIHNNFIQLIVDSKYEYPHVIKLIDIIKKFGPLQIDYEFSYTTSKMMTGNPLKISNEKEMVATSNISKLSYITKFIDGLDLSNMEEAMKEAVDKDDLKRMITDYYDAALEELKGDA